MSPSKKQAPRHLAIRPQQAKLESSSLGLQELAQQLPASTPARSRLLAESRSSDPRHDTIDAPPLFEEEESPSSSGFLARGTYGSSCSEGPPQPCQWLRSPSEPLLDEAEQPNITTPNITLATQQTNIPRAQLTRSRPLAETEPFNYAKGLSILAKAGRQRAMQQARIREERLPQPSMSSEQITIKTDISDLIAPEYQQRSSTAASPRKYETLPAPAEAPASTDTALEIEVILSKPRNKV